MDPKVSIIIPYYNCEVYLDRCIFSVRNQTYKNLEIVLINDGSTDSGPDIVHKHCIDDHRVVNISQQNTGLGGARNRGLLEAAGDYITFLDADDWMVKDCIRIMLSYALSKKADIVECSYYMNYEGSNVSRKFLICKKPQFIAVQNHKRTVSDVKVVAWNKLYRREIMQGEQFPTGMIHEDVGLVPFLAAKSKLIIRVPDTLIHYTQRKGSLSKVISENNYLDKIKCCDHLFRKFIEQSIFEDFKNELYFRLLKTFAFLSVRVPGKNGRREIIIKETLKLREAYFPGFRYKGSLSYILIDHALNYDSRVIRSFLCSSLDTYDKLRNLISPALKIHMNFNHIRNVFSIISGKAPHVNLPKIYRAIKRRIRGRDRINNGLLEITTEVGCPNNCTYCPQDVFVGAYNKFSRTKELSMSFQDFKSYLRTVPDQLPISFSGLSEPWNNHCCTDMVLYAHAKGHPIMIFTSLQGMTVEDYKAIRHIPFITFTVHLPDDQGHMSMPVDDQYLQLLKLIVTLKPRNLNFNCHISRPAPAIREIVDWHGPPIHDRAGNARLTKTGQKTAIDRIQCDLCGRMLNRNILLPDGTILLCSMDFGMKHILGDLKVDNYRDLHKNNKFDQLQKALDDPQESLLCRKCIHAIGIRQ